MNLNRYKIEWKAAPADPTKGWILGEQIIWAESKDEATKQFGRMKGSIGGWVDYTSVEATHTVEAKEIVEEEK